MALTRRIVADTGSEEVRLLREQVNLLITAVESFKAGIITDAATAITNVAAIDLSDLRLIVTSTDIPPAPHPTDV